MTKRRIELISNSEVSHQTKGFSPPARIATLKVTPSVRSLQEWNFLDFPDLDFAIPLILGQPKLNGLTNVANIETYSIPENVKYIGKKTFTSTILNISKLPFSKTKSKCAVRYYGNTYDILEAGNNSLRLL
jgi:hypothetical protein